MKIVTVSANTPSIVVPDNCVAVLAFSVFGLVAEPVGTDFISRRNRALLSADPNVNVTQADASNSVNLLAIADQTFPKIPVSAGERLFVAIESTGTAVIYFETAEI